MKPRVRRSSWWKNNGTQPVDLTIADLVNDRKPETMKEKIM